MNPGSREHVFIVRTWLERADDASTMRGQIDHVASGQRRYFANFGELCDFVAGAQTLPPIRRADGDGST